jgi:ABC-type sugar transport system ATPase subunit
MGEIDSCIRSALGVGASLIRFALTPILCGDRNSAGKKWQEISGADGASLTLANGDGAPVSVALSAPAPANGGSRKVTLGVRPEHISLHRAERAGEKRAGVVVSAIVDVVEPTGAETMVGLRLAGRGIIARFEPDDAPEVGQKINVSIDMARACLFDAVSEPPLG